MSNKHECGSCQRNHINRPKWGPGPWQNEPDRVEFEAHGFPCILHRNQFGAWCGYVGVPPAHPYHGKDYNDVNLSVHGGLTYAAPCDDVLVCHVPEPGESDNVWWLGFDCAHAGDLAPQMRRDHADWPGAVEETYRDMAYARAETEHLAEQLSGSVAPIKPMQWRSLSNSQL